MNETRRPSRIAIALRAARPLAHANIAPPILLGQALAFRLEGSFSLGAFAFAHLFGLFDHLFIVFANDYADRRSDGDLRTWVSGGSGVLVEGLVRPRTLALAATLSALALFALSLAWSLTAAALALAAVALLLAYSYPPAKLSYRGGGEWLQGLGVGLVLPWVGFHAQAGALAPPFATLLGPVLLATAGNVVTAMPDHEDDSRAEKRTLPVKLGPVRAARAAEVMTLAGIALTVALAPIGTSARVALFGAAALPLAFASARGLSAGDTPWVVAMGISHQCAVLGLAIAAVASAP